MPFKYICSPLRSLRERNQRLNLNRVSVHADLLNTRHIQGDLARIVPMQQFLDADCFLFLRVEFQESEVSNLAGWVPWSLVYIAQPPRYLIESYQINKAQELLDPFKVANVEMLKSKIIEVTPRLKGLFNSPELFMFRKHPLGDFDPQFIGSRP